MTALRPTAAALVRDHNRVTTVQFVGSGDAFGSGGRFQACISLRWAQAHVLLDCVT